MVPREQFILEASNLQKVYDDSQLTKRSTLLASNGSKLSAFWDPSFYSTCELQCGLD
jgi:hypothetical protein